MDKLKRWENETQELANYFVSKYFGKNADCGWIAEEIGGVLCVNDYFFDFNSICNILRASLSRKKMFDKYDKNLKNNENLFLLQTNKKRK